MLRREGIYDNERGVSADVGSKSSVLLVLQRDLVFNAEGSRAYVVGA